MVIPGMLFALACLVATAIWSLFVIFGGPTMGDRGARVSRLLRVWGVLASTGIAGLGVGVMRFPESNLLGGYGLVFGPLWMVAGPITLLLLVLLVRARRTQGSRPT